MRIELTKSEIEIIHFFIKGWMPDTTEDDFIKSSILLKLGNKWRK